MSETLEQMIERHEGARSVPYIDSVGIQTIGIGHNLQKPLSRAAMEQILEDDIADARADCLHQFSWFADLTDSRQWAMIDLCFNMGINRLLTFKNFLLAMSLGDYETAAGHLLDSLYAKQVKGRAREIANMIRGAEDI
jgi:lysozyme